MAAELKARMSRAMARDASLTGGTEMTKAEALAELDTELDAAIARRDDALEALKRAEADVRKARIAFVDAASQQEELK